VNLIENTPENVEKIATAFVGELREWLTPAQFETMRLDNRHHLNRGRLGICASGDVCDSNMAMDAAFNKSFGRSPHLPCDVEEGKCSDDDVSQECEIWNSAWDLAKERDLTAPNWQYAFRDFPVADMPAVPKDWKDDSWHNDACPFFNTPNALGVFVDYANIDAREHDGPRFNVVRMNDDGTHMTESDTVLATDDWQAVLDFVSTYGTAPKTEATA
jgi:hypothetical protein